MEQRPPQSRDNVLVSSPQADYDGLRHVSPETPCPYVAGRRFRGEAYYIDVLDPDTLGRLIDRGFRRSGRIVYRPRCRGCRACRPLRVPVRTFRRTRSMRRVWSGNADVRVEVGDFVPTVEKFLLYRRYLDAQHDGAVARTFDAFRDFLYDSPAESGEFCYLLGGRLIGVSVVDRCRGGLSSVFMYFDPRFRTRSPGTFSILWEIAYCRRRGLDYYHLGYYVAGSKTMDYKARFRPNEVLSGDPPKPDWVSFRE